MRGDRIFGLDLMRATSGVMVMVSHTSHLVADHWPAFPAIPYVDWVNLFFVLSGFLIGGILLDTLASPAPAALRFADFMQRRWLRTLPNYYLFLCLNIALVHAGTARGILTHATPAYFVFMQNFHVPLDLFFWESWSLAVEEWFYLLFPLIMFTLVGLVPMGGQRAFLVACAIFILAPVGGRLLVAQHVVDGGTWDLWVRKMVITRLDAPGMGMLAAWICRRWPRPWRAVRWPLLLFGLAALLVLARRESGAVDGFRVIGYESAYVLAVALLMPLLSTWRSGGVFAGPVRWLSLITYALYLVHFPLLYAFGHLVPDPVAWQCAARYAAFVGAALAASTLVYLYWERPFMRLRAPLGRWLELRWGR